jgi:hypothetical protein
MNGSDTAGCTEPAAPPLDGSAGRPVRVYGVDYRVFEDAEGGALYVTGHGLPMLGYLRPRRWYRGKQYVERGRRLAPTVYRLEVDRSVAASSRPPLKLVVKFSRFAQDVPLEIQSTFDGALHAGGAAEARFLDPFQEFGLLGDLRRGRIGPPSIRIRTKRPLAIYKAPGSNPAWKLGRNKGDLSRLRRELGRDQQDAETPVELAADHVYVTLFHWVEGLNLLEAWQAGLIEESEIEPVTRRVADELRQKGFMVLDHKPQHVIVRPKGDGVLRRDDGLPAYAIIDFELLEKRREQ